MLIRLRTLKSLNSTEKIQQRLMVATFNGNPSTTIISYTALPMLEKKRTSSPSITNYPPLFSQHDSSNRNGKHLTDFMLENRLTCLNTKFQKREGKLWTYTYANNAEAQIDYILIYEKWNNSALNCEVYSSFESVSSDHRIVRAKKQLCL